MGRRRHKSRSASAAPPNLPAQPLSWVERILALPRLARIGLASLIALMAALAATPVIDNLYVAYFFDMETRLAPALLLALLGMIVYGIGWVLIVGLAGEGPRLRRATSVYLAAGAMLILLVLGLILAGVYANVRSVF